MKAVAVPPPRADRPPQARDPAPAGPAAAATARSSAVPSSVPPPGRTPTGGPTGVPTGATQREKRRGITMRSRMPTRGHGAAWAEDTP